MNRELSAARQWASLAVLVAGVLLLAIDATVLYLAVPALTADLAPTATQVLWIGDIYSLAVAGFLVTMGNLADRVGRKRLLLIGAAAFGFASLLAGFAPNPGVLIAARLILGIAGATIMPSTLSLIRVIFPDEGQRTKAVAIWSAASSGGIAIGPLVGGALLEHFWWGSVFLINLPVVVLLLTFGAWLLPESRNPQPAPFDLISSLLSLLAIVPFVFVIKQLAGGDFGPVTIGAFVAGVVGLVLFVSRQRRSEDPMIDVGLFANPAFTGAVLVNLISIFALAGVLFFFSQYLQLARGLSPLGAGIAQLPVALGAMSAFVFVGFLFRRLGRGRAIAAALLLGAAGLVGVSVAEHTQSLGWVLVALVPLGLGNGIAEALSIDAVVTAVRPEKAGSAASISETAYELGGALGIAILGSVVTVLYRAHLVLPAHLSPAAAEQTRDSLASAAQVLDPGSTAFAAAREAFVNAMETTTLIAAAIMVVAALVAHLVIPAGKERNVVHA